jgi:hypothetical protein
MARKLLFQIIIHTRPFGIETEFPVGGLALVPGRIP